MKKLGTLILGAILTIGIGAGISPKTAIEPVYAASTVEYTMTIDKDDFNTTSYAANNNTKTSTATATDNSGSTIDVEWTSYQVMQQSNVMQWQKSKGCIYNETSLGTITNITIDSDSGTFTTCKGNSKQPTSDGTGGYFNIKVGSATGKVNSIVITFTSAAVDEDAEIFGITASKKDENKLWYVGDTITNDDINVYTVDEDGNNISKITDFTIQDAEITSEKHTITVVYGDFNKTLTFDAIAIEESDYQLLTDASNLVIGSKIIIAAAESELAVSTTQNSNNRGQTEIKKVNNSIVEPNENVQIFTLEAGTVENTYAFNTGSGYIYAASSSSNYLRTQTTNDANGSWKIELAEGGIATITAQGTNTRNLLKYNDTSKIFSCYGSGQNDVCLYAILPEAGLVTTIDLDVENGVYTKNSEVQINATVNEDALNKTLAYTSSNEAVATVSDTGLIRFVGIGSATITVSSTDGSEISKSIDVVCTNNNGLTVDTAFTAEEAVVVAALYASNSETEYFVKDIMTKIDTEYSSQHGNISITLGGAFKLYRMTITEGQANDLVVGDIVTAKGHIINYGGHTPEFAQGCELLSIEYTAASVAARIKTMADGWDNRVTTENCYNNYAAANELVSALSETELETFKTSTDTEIASARTTYEHWCFVNGAKAYEETVPAGSRLSAFNNSNNIIIIVVAISSLVILATAGLLISRKRRYSK